MSDTSDSSGLWMASPKPSRKPLGVYGPASLVDPKMGLNTSTLSSSTTDAPEINSGRTRGLSRSFSAPSMTRNIDHTSQSGSGTDDHLNSSISSNAGPNIQPGSRNSTSSVRHLTCFWWKEKGNCRLNDNDCLYAHYDTGHYTDAPRQLIPGEPAMAGRRLDRAMRGLTLSGPRSTISMSNAGGSRNGSRPTTPGFQANIGVGTNNFASSFHSPLSLPSHLDPEIVRLNDDNQFLRTLVDQNGKEKAIMISTIESLQDDNKMMKGEMEGLRKAQEQLLAEREGLHKRIQQLEGGKTSNIAGTRSVSNPFGAIGRGRVNTETRYLGGLLTEE